MIAILAVIVGSIFVYLPILFNSSIFFDRGNDLTEFFLPILQYIKTELRISHQIPFWRTYSVGGMPLAADPQSQIFYLPNILLLFSSLTSSLLMLLIIHSIVGGLSMYFLCKKAFSFGKLPSAICAFLWVSSSKLFTYMEAGHLGLITGWCWIPLALLAFIMLHKNAKKIWSVLLAVSLAGLFYSHIFNFIIYCLFLVVIWFFIKPSKYSLKSYIWTGILLICFIAPSFLSQMEWHPSTTRQLLLTNPDVYPHWLTKREFIKSFFWPLLATIPKLWDLDTEKWITLGIVPSLLALLGLLRLSKRKRLIIFCVLIIFSLIALNNLSPFTPLLLKFDWYKTLRVSTRFWFLVVLGSILLTGYWIHKSQKNFFRTIIIAALIFESIFLSWIRILKPYSSRTALPSQIYNHLAADSEIFRVLCLTRCIPALEAVNKNIELVDGYATLIQMNYYNKFKQFIQSNWDYYSLSLPPFGTYLYENLQPDAVQLGEFNTKYIISTYTLTNPNFLLVDTFKKYYLYENKSFLPRVRFADSAKTQPIILNSSANQMTIAVDKQEGELVIANIYSNGWEAQFDGKTKVPVKESISSLQEIIVPPQTSIVKLSYRPVGLLSGFTILVLGTPLAILQLLQN